MKKKVECLLRDEIVLEGMLSEEDIKSYFKKTYPNLVISNIKTTISNDLSLQAILYSNVLTALSANIENEKQIAQLIKEPSVASAQMTDFNMDSKSADQGKLILKYIKAIRKKSEGTIVAETLIKLFDNMDNEINKWRKILNLPISETKSAPIKQPAVVPSKNEFDSIYAQQIMMMKSQIENLDAAKTQLEAENKELKMLKPKDKNSRSNSTAGQAGGSEIKYKQLQETTEKMERSYQEQIKELEYKLRSNEEKSKQNNVERTKSIKEVENNSNSQLKSDNDKLNYNIILLEKKNTEYTIKIDSLTSEIRKKKDEIKENETQFQNLISNLEVANNTITTLTTEKRELQNQVDNLKDKSQKDSQFSSQIDALNQELASTKLSLNKALDNITQCNKKYSEYDNELAVKNNQISKTSTQLIEKEEIISKYITEKSTLNEKLRVTTSNLEMMRQSCESSEKEKTLLNEKIKLLEEKIDDIKALKEELSKKITDLESKKNGNESNYKQILSEKCNLDIELSTSKQQIKTLIETNQQIEGQVHKLKKENEEHKSKISEINGLLAQKESEKEKIQQQLNNIQIKHNKLDEFHKGSTNEIQLLTSKLKEVEIGDAKQKKDILEKNQTIEKIKFTNSELSNENKSLKETTSNQIQTLTQTIENSNRDKAELINLLNTEKSQNAEAQNTIRAKEEESKKVSDELTKCKNALITLEKKKQETESSNSSFVSVVEKYKSDLNDFAKKASDLNNSIAKLKDSNKQLEGDIRRKEAEITKLKDSYSFEMATKAKELLAKDMDISYYKGIAEESKNREGGSIESYKADMESMKKMLESKDNLFESLNKKFKESEYKIIALKSEHGKEMEALEADCRSKIKSFEDKISNLEIASVKLNTQVNEPQTENKLTIDEKLSVLMKESTDIQVKYMTIKREKEIVGSELSLFKKQLEKEQLNREIIESKYNALTAEAIEFKLTIEKLNSDSKLLSGKLKDEEQKSIQLIEECNKHKEKLNLQEQIILQNNKKISELESSLTTTQESLLNTLFTAFSKIKLYSTHSLWDQPKLTTFSEQNLISAIQMRIDKIDAEVRMAELSRYVKEVIQANTSICNLTQSLLDRAGTKCDGINLLLESKQLYDEGSKEYQIVAIKKYKAIVPFMKEVSFDIKNKDLLIKMINTYIVHKQKKLNKLQEDFGQYRKLNLSAEKAKKDNEQVLIKYNEIGQSHI